MEGFQYTKTSLEDTSNHSGMKMIGVLASLQNQSAGDRPFDVALACSYTPLRLLALLNATKRRRRQEKYAGIRAGLCCDPIGVLPIAGRFVPGREQVTASCTAPYDAREDHVPTSAETIAAE
jgi:hypothetical protein